MNKIKAFFAVRKQKKSWDYNLDYESTYKSIVSEISTLRRELDQGNITGKKLKKFCYLVIGLIQIRNGARIGEVAEAMKLFCNGSHNRDVETLVQKRKDEYYRQIVLPGEITAADINYIKPVIDERFGKDWQGRAANQNKMLFVQTVSRFFKNTFGFSTHALRYCFISFMAVTKKLQPNVIAKITGHRTLDMILNYTNKKLADFELFNMSLDFGFG
jgi:hypothetical protein